MRAWRIANRAFPLMDGAGAATYPGRWNARNQRALYCGASFAITMLERLCYTSIGRTPKTDVYVGIEIPDALLERFDPDGHAGWERPGSAVAKAYGARWFTELRSAALLVPSAVTQLDWNVVVNPVHPGFAEISWSTPKPVVWDRRLFSQ